MSRTAVLRFFSKPGVGIAGSLASLVSLPLAVYFYVESVRDPELVYYVNPARAIVAKQGMASRLEVSFDGQEIYQDVTAVQIAIWNRGKDPVRRSAVLQPLTIRTDKNVPIFEATLRKTSREVVQLELDQSRMASGELQLSWNILEQWDGGVVQVVYAGSPDTHIDVIAIIEGQTAIQELRYSGTIKSPSEQVQSRRLSGWFLVGLIAASILLLYSWTVGWKAWRLDTNRTTMNTVIWAINMVLPLIALCILAYAYASRAPSPPFGFD